jgi:hypothetical protein
LKEKEAKRTSRVFKRYRERAIVNPSASFTEGFTLAPPQRRLKTSESFLLLFFKKEDLPFNVPYSVTIA